MLRKRSDRGFSPVGNLCIEEKTCTPQSAPTHPNALQKTRKRTHLRASTQSSPPRGGMETQQCELGEDSSSPRWVKTNVFLSSSPFPPSQHPGLLKTPGSILHAVFCVQAVLGLCRDISDAPWSCLRREGGGRRRRGGGVLRADLVPSSLQTPQAESDLSRTGGGGETRTLNWTLRHPKWTETYGIHPACHYGTRKGDRPTGEK